MQSMNNDQIAKQLNSPGAIIRRIRRGREQSQELFGAELGIKKQYVNAWERGVRRPGARTIERWANDPREWVRAMARDLAAALITPANLPQPPAAVPAGGSDSEKEPAA